MNAAFATEVTIKAIAPQKNAELINTENPKGLVWIVRGMSWGVTVLITDILTNNVIDCWDGPEARIPARF